MKIFLTSLIFSLSCIIVNAQQDRFIYLQTENKKPFFVKLNSKVFNSYPLGYLIIPKLDDGLNSLVIGFLSNYYFGCCKQKILINMYNVLNVISNTDKFVLKL